MTDQEQTKLRNLDIKHRAVRIYAADLVEQLSDDRPDLFQFIDGLLSINGEAIPDSILKHVRRDTILFHIEEEKRVLDQCAERLLEERAA